MTTGLLPCLILHGELGVLRARYYDVDAEWRTFIVGCLVTGFFGFLLRMFHSLSMKARLYPALVTPLDLNRKLGDDPDYAHVLLSSEGRQTDNPRSRLCSIVPTTRCTVFYTWAQTSKPRARFPKKNTEEKPFGGRGDRWTGSRIAGAPGSYPNRSTCSRTQADELLQVKVVKITPPTPEVESRGPRGRCARTTTRILQTPEWDENSELCVEVVNIGQPVSVSPQRLQHNDDMEECADFKNRVRLVDTTLRDGYILNGHTVRRISLKAWNGGLRWLQDGKNRETDRMKAARTVGWTLYTSSASMPPLPTTIARTC
ncbi:hypothetical protein B0H16DRAFT_1478914 [Mycena metata]|uniref:Uncharacterized protein n=1 Tax=Mycena metata TaxID=1033252 RepID=A0AAD7MEB5_9AGAR|nr:hypothetical protein B0H16DRAFT_1478914 [Mycena metata]